MHWINQPPELSCGELKEWAWLIGAVGSDGGRGHRWWLGRRCLRQREADPESRPAHQPGQEEESRQVLAQRHLVVPTTGDHVRPPSLVCQRGA